ncbi:unnamed protein product [Urochloa decumbens]|uniref:F-box domain-containing protein n=1 Tax=Urochloa decumbens TaxID=240449 RepID=A0ABC8VWZ3_9POAL
MADDSRRRSGEDLISGLPDELLHAILARLRSARAAARTSVLSRRWRNVWPHLPEILLDVRLEAAAAAASFPDAVDGALAGCMAPALKRLRVSLSAEHDLRVPAGRVAPWLRFAAGRVVGELFLVLPLRRPHVEEEAGLELPVCRGARKVTVVLEAVWRLRIQPQLFPALTTLFIHCGTMDGGELSDLVCTRCPRLRNLSLFVTLVAVTSVTIRSDSLRSLCFRTTNTQRLEVVAPGLKKLSLDHCIQAHISAPKLSQLVWYGTYDRRNHQFPDVGRRIRELKIGMDSAAPSLMRRFDEVDVLGIKLCILQGIVGYQGFLNDMEKKLPKCKTLRVSLLRNHHGLAPIILHLLRPRSCNSTRKISLAVLHHPKDACPSSCPCCSEESRRFDDTDLGSLDEVEITSLKGFHEEFEFVELLSRCNARALKKLVINYMMPRTPETKEVCNKVRSMCRPNVKVEFYVFPDGPNGGRVRFG